MGDGQQEVLDYAIDTIQKEKEVFSVLNSVFLSSVFFIRIKGKIKAPIQIIHISSVGAVNGSQGLKFVCPRLLIILEKDSEAIFYEKYAKDMDNCFFNYAKDYIVKENASLTLKVFQKAEPFNTCHFEKSSLYLEKEANVFITCALSGTKIMRSHYEAYMNGESAHFSINAISILKGEEQSHNYIKVHHKTKNTTSKQVFKSIVKDKAKTSVDTTVVVYEGAAKTESSQLMQSLVLSDNAKSDNKPNLMIYADDVKCAHGATVGNIDEDSVFYLKTRGIELEEARKLLLTGFVKTIIDDMDSKELIDEVEQTLLAKLEA